MVILRAMTSPAPLERPPSRFSGWTPPAGPPSGVPSVDGEPQGGLVSREAVVRELVGLLLVVLGVLGGLGAALVAHPLLFAGLCAAIAVGTGWWLMTGSDVSDGEV